VFKQAKELDLGRKVKAKPKAKGRPRYCTDSIGLGVVEPKSEVKARPRRSTRAASQSDVGREVAAEKMPVKQGGSGSKSSRQ